MAEFTNDEIKEYICGALIRRTGDNLERCQMSFNNLTDKEMQNEYGQSGMTCKKILDDYKKERRLYHMSIDAINRVDLR